MVDYLKQHTGESIPADDLLAKMLERSRPLQHPKRVEAETLEAMQRMVDEGCSQSEIARTLNVSRNTVRARFPEAAWSRQQIAEISQATRRYNNAMRGKGFSQGVLE